MKFSFRFDYLLKIYRHDEKKRQQKLGQALSRRQKLETSIRKLQEQLNHYEAHKAEGGPETASGIRRRYELKQDMQKNIWNLKRKREEAEAQVQQRRRELQEANKKTRMLEKLEGRERAAFVEYHQQQEQLEQNEIAIRMYNRSN